MPRYRVTGPDGHKYEITAPNGVSQEDVMGMVQKHVSSSTAEERAPPEGYDPPVFAEGPAAYNAGMEWVDDKFMQGGQNVEQFARERMHVPPRSAEALGRSTYVGLNALTMFAPSASGAVNAASRVVRGAGARLASREGPELAARIEPTLSNSEAPAVWRSGRDASVPLSDIGGAAADIPGASVARPRGRLPFEQEMPLSDLSKEGGTLPKTSIRHPANAVKLDTFNEAHQAGYVFPPTAIEPSMTRKALEKIGGKQPTQAEATLRNQQTTNNLARKTLGLADDVALDEGVLNNFRDVKAAPYREVARLSDDAAQALELLKDTRHEATIYHRHADRTADPASIKRATQLDAEVKGWEQYIEEQAARAGKPDLVDRLRKARVAIAQSHDIERALNLGTGDVDAKVFGRLLDQRGSGGLSGNLLTIGRTAKAFPQYMGSGVSVHAPGVSALDPMLAVHGMSTGRALAGGLPLARGPARAAALSQGLQRPRRELPRLGTVPLSELSRYGGGLALTPGLGLRVPETDEAQ